jgi:hypothetical protein
MISWAPLWVDPSGTALLAGWRYYAAGGREVTHFGMMNHGRFSPLPAPPPAAAGIETAIAW